MIHSISSFLSKQLVKQGVVDPDYRIVYEYGIELMVSSFIGISLIALMGTLVFSLVDSIIFLVCFILVRSFCGGYHANSYLVCNICSITSFSIVSILSRIDWIPKLWLVVLLLICLFIITYISPIESPFKAIDSNDRIKFKIISSMLFIFFSVISLLLVNENEHCFRQLAYTLIVITALAIIGYTKKIRSRKEK